MFGYIIFCENSTSYRRVRCACDRQKVDFVSRKHVKEGVVEYYLLAEKIPATELRDGFKVFELKGDINE